MQTQEQKELVENAIELAQLHGILKYLPDGQLTHAPFSLSPYYITKSDLAEMTELTAAFSELMISVSQNWDFLEHHLGPISANDPFLQMLLNCRTSEIMQSRQLLVQRNDFFITNDEQSPDKQNCSPEYETNAASLLRQVELNTVSVSFPFLATKLTQLHHYLYEQNCLKQVIQNNPLDAVVDAFAKAVRDYDIADSVMLIVIQPKEKNIFDQLGLEQLMWEKHKISTIRKILSEIYRDGKLREGHLVVDSKTVAVTYFRAGYTPDDFSTKDAVKGRQLIEASSSIQVPDLAMHLSGMKKIQQVLTKQEVLSDFVSPDLSGRFSKTFAKMHTLDEIIDTPEGEVSAAEWVSKHPEDYVLKPQREGGGNNYFGSDILNLLPTIRKEEQKAYILMVKIKPQIHSAILVVNGQAETLNCVSEIGRFGICFAENGVVKNNRDVGYLVRTKAENVNEGGVCAGFACLNTIADIDDQQESGN